MSNPFFATWDTPFGLPPFADISEEHFSEAFDAAYAEHQREIDAIAASSEPPDLENTIVALERAGSLRRKVFAVFGNITNTDTNEVLQQLESEIAPRDAAHVGALYTNQALFQRVKAVRDAKPALDRDQQLLLEDTYREFERHGAALPEDKRAELAALDARLATLKTTFSQNLLKDTSAYELVLNDEALLAGLPQGVIDSARAEAEQRGKPGTWVFTISRSSITPFLQFADSRDLREQIYQAYVHASDNDNEFSNRDIVSEITGLRVKRANLLGFPTHAHFMLDDRMAGTPGKVHQLLDQVWAPARKRLMEEQADLQQLIQEEGNNFPLQAWDWWYYTEKLRSQRFDLDDAEVKPYFKLENVRDGVFAVASRLFGLQFQKLDSFPKYHPDVEAWDVQTADGEHVGVFLADYFARQTKRGGAWMNEFRAQSGLDGEVRPIVVNCCNFVKSDPCLLSMDEVRTLFHEFGHGLHGLMSRVRYESQGGTNVKQDFVELPSQIMEHWALEPEVMKQYARHAETGEVIPDALIDKLKQASTFNQGFAKGEYLAACYLDMQWHQQRGEGPFDATDMEQQAMERIEYPAILDPRYKSTYFQHIFSGDHYSAGYYVYIWAEVLDADGFEAFKENGIFDEATARRFRENILEKGGTEEPMELYRRFRGQEPDVGPLLRNLGFA